MTSLLLHFLLFISLSIKYASLSDKAKLYLALSRPLYWSNGGNFMRSLRICLVCSLMLRVIFFFIVMQRYNDFIGYSSIKTIIFLHRYFYLLILIELYCDILRLRYRERLNERKNETE